MSALCGAADSKWDQGADFGQGWHTETQGSGSTQEFPNWGLGLSCLIGSIATPTWSISEQQWKSGQTALKTHLRVQVVNRCDGARQTEYLPGMSAECCPSWVYSTAFIYLRLLQTGSCLLLWVVPTSTGPDNQPGETRWGRGTLGVQTLAVHFRGSALFKS